MTGVILTPLVTYYFASKNPQMSLIYTALFGAGSIVGLIVSAAAVPSLSKKYGTKRLFVTVNLINIFPNLLLFALYIKYPQNMTDIPQTVAMFVLTLITGSCVSISSTVQMLIISQAVDLEEKISGNRPDALFFSAADIYCQDRYRLVVAGGKHRLCRCQFFFRSNSSAQQIYCKRRNTEA